MGYTPYTNVVRKYPVHVLDPSPGRKPGSRPVGGTRLRKKRFKKKRSKHMSRWFMVSEKTLVRVAAEMEHVLYRSIIRFVSGNNG